MSILKKIAKLKDLSKKIQLMQEFDQSKLTDKSLTMVENLFNEIVNIKSDKTELSDHLHGNLKHDSPIKSSAQKTDVSFQFTHRLSSLLQDDVMPFEEVKLTTSSIFPIKSAPPSPTKLKSPSKQPSSRFILSEGFEIEKNINQLEEKSIAEARTADYLSRIIKLDKKIQETIFELEQKVDSNKDKMKKSFKILMLESNLPYDETYSEALLGELFDIVHRNEGTFEKLVKALSLSFADKLKEKQKNLFGHELVLMSELTEDQTPSERRKIYLDVEFNKLKFVVKTLKDKIIYGVLDIDIGKMKINNLCKEHLPSLKELIASEITQKDQKRLFVDEIAKINLEVRKNVIEANPKLFTELGKISPFPEAYFNSNELSKTLAQNFIQALYASPERIKVMINFQQEKEKTIKLETLDRILSRMPELYNQDILYCTNPYSFKCEYVKSINDLKEIGDIKMVEWREISDKIQHRLLDGNFWGDKLTDEAIEGILKAAEKTYNEILNTFNAMSVISEQNTCISFFPIKLESQMNPMPQHVCLVTTSGDTEKLSKFNEKNKLALIAFQEMIKNFAKEFGQQQVEGLPFTFVYHDQEKGTIDVLLQQLNKGLSGHAQPLLSHSSDNEMILSDPFRGCAEKKFIAFVRDTLNGPFKTSSLKILGAANLRMPIIPSVDNMILFNQCILDLHQTISKNSEEKPDNFCLNVNKTITEHAEQLTNQSVTLGKMYQRYLEKHKISIYLKTKKPLSIKKVIIDSDYEVNCSEKQKQIDLENLGLIQNQFCQLYEISIDFLKGKKSGSFNDFLLKEKYDSILPKTQEIDKMLLELPVKFEMEKNNFKKITSGLPREITYACSPKNENFEKIDILIEKYSKHIRDMLNNLKSKIPNKFFVFATYEMGEGGELETDFIDCCTACQANKLPVLTWLTDLQLASQNKHKECSTNPLLFSSCFHSPQKSVPGNNTTTLSPVMKALNFEDALRDDERDEMNSQTLNTTNLSVKRKLF